MPARYCLFYERQHLQIAAVTAPRTPAGEAPAEEEGAPTALALRLPDGSERSLPRARALLVWEEPGPPQPLEAVLAALRQAATAVDTAALHTRLHPADGEERTVTLEALHGAAEPPPEDPRAMAALFIALLGDKQHFQFVRGHFLVRGAKQIRRRKEAAHAAAAHATWLRRVQDWAARLEAGQPLPPDAGGEGAAFLEMLRSLVTHWRRSPHWKTLAGPLGVERLREDERPARLRAWLEAAGAWPGWPAIALDWGGVATAIAPELEALAAGLAQAPLDAAGRTDYRGTPTYSFDSAFTRDIDDAVSVLEADGQSVLVALHIAEPSRALQPGHPLFDEAAERMASVYTVQGIYPLFPLSLSEGRFSLLRGTEREALTLLVRLRGGEAALEAVQPSLVCLNGNLDYDQGAVLLRDEAPWQALAQACEELAQARAARGAVLAERTDVWLDTADPAHLSLYQTLRSGAIHRTVEELAIVYNEQAGLHAQAQHLPAIYRVQHHRDPDAEDERNPAFYGVRGGPHAGLACRRYAQATSPIRRFPDLIVQRQLASHAATGHPAFAHRNELSAWAKAANLRLSLYNVVEERIFEDWMMRYLAQNPTARFQGTVRRTGARGKGKVWLPALRILVDATWPGTHRPGDTVRLHITAVDRDRRQISGEVEA